MNDAEKNQDLDTEETKDWLDALRTVLKHDGADRVHYLIERQIDLARRSGVYLPYSAHTAYVNSIPVGKETLHPGDIEMEKRISSLIRWNAMAMVVRANRESSELGGHIASFASSATLYNVGFNHFWNAPSDEHGGDLVFFQGHVAPGIYARAFLEGRLTEEALINFRQEALSPGLSSYPHPRLLPEFWQFPTVSMGLGPIQAIYQARFMKYLYHRGLEPKDNRKVWAFVGDGEMDEPESLGALSVAGRENLDNLIFVVNCNLQRLDGPVRGNSKIIQELESEFRGAGWNVIKVIWGRYWDPLLAQDVNGLLRKRMEEAVDGEYQAFKAKGGAYTREKFFGKYPELKAMVANMSDDDIWRLNRGGHDPYKVYAAYADAVAHKGQPTVILVKTVKGYGMGIAGEGQNSTHSQKKMGEKALHSFRDRFHIPVSDEELKTVPFYRPDEDSEEIRYLKACREKLGGYLPARRQGSVSLQIPGMEAFQSYLKDSGKREFSTTMAFVRMLTMLARDKNIGKHVVPIVSDEARTFGMEGLFRQLGIYAPEGQLYEPEDSDQLLFYREDQKGRILEEGITEAGAFSSWMAAGTSYSNHGLPMIPFFIFYSMFGFQRIGDLAWAAGDIQARGFLIGGTAGRTTLAGEGLQHQDGHSHLVASSIPACIAYDPTFSYELAVIVQDGMRRMFQEQESVFYYITTMNENYTHPAMPEGVQEGIIQGMYLFKEGNKKKAHKIQLVGSGSILREVIVAAQMLEAEFDVSATIWSATSFTELSREGLNVQRWNLLHPEATPQIPYVEQCLGTETPVVIATDYMKHHGNMIRNFIKAPCFTLGTDGFGRSDTRAHLREYFEVNHQYIVVSALKILADSGAIPVTKVSQVIQRFNLDPEKGNPADL